MDAQIAADRLAEMEMQAAAALGPPTVATVDRPAEKAEEQRVILTQEQADFITRNQCRFAAEDGKIIVWPDAGVRGPIPRGIIIRTWSKQAKRLAALKARGL